jgi:hypothetical protein
MFEADWVKAGVALLFEMGIIAKDMTAQEELNLLLCKAESCEGNGS